MRAIEQKKSNGKTMQSQYNGTERNDETNVVLAIAVKIFLSKKFLNYEVYISWKSGKNTLDFLGKVAIFVLASL